MWPSSFAFLIRAWRSAHWIWEGNPLPAYVASQVDDEKLEELLTSSDIPAEKILDNWLTVAERFDSNAELVTSVLGTIGCPRKRL
jgi:hypothetical protein